MVILLVYSWIKYNLRIRYLCWGWCVYAFTFACRGLGEMLGLAQREEWQLVQRWAILGVFINNRLIMLFNNMFQFFCPWKYNQYFIIILTTINKVQAAQPSILCQIFIGDRCGSLFSLLFILWDNIEFESCASYPTHGNEVCNSIWHVYKSYHSHRSDNPLENIPCISGTTCKQQQGNQQWPRLLFQTIQKMHSMRYLLIGVVLSGKGTGNTNQYTQGYNTRDTSS